MSAREQSRGEMIFHHPFPLTTDARSGSRLRPMRMLDGFRQLGYNVVEVTGYTPERVPLMRRLARDIAAGRRFEFCYSESVTSPTALSDPRHLPLHPLADPAFFRSLRRAGIRTGLYYRDIHWRFDQYDGAVSLPKKVAVKVFYRFDLAWYAKLVDIVYLPDLGMSSAIPGAGRFTFAALPPGTMIEGEGRPRASGGGQVRLFYIGSVSPPHNDVSPLLRAVRATPGVALTISCPAAEAEKLEGYPSELLDGVDVVHLNSEQAGDYYAGSDIACLVYSPHPYRDFAMPVKLFESIGHLTPTIVNTDTAAGRFVARNGIGWTFDDESDLRRILSRLVDSPSLLEEKRSTLHEVAPSHTWTARAATVAGDLGRPVRSG